MAGRRRRGTAAASATNLLSELLLEDRRQRSDRKQKAAELALKFQTELALSKAKAGLPYTDPVTGQQVAGQDSIGLADLVDPSSLPEGLKLTQKLPGGLTATASRPTPELLNENQAQQFLLPANPGVPFPGQRTPVFGEDPEGGITKIGTGGGIPTTVAGRNTLQGAINRGLTESPASEQLIEENPGILQQILSQIQGLDGIPGPLLQVPQAISRGASEVTNRVKSAIPALSQQSTIPQDIPQDILTLDPNSPEIGGEGAQVQSQETGEIYEFRNGQWILVQ